MEFSSRGNRSSTGPAGPSSQPPLAVSWADDLEPALVARLKSLAATVREGRQKLLAGEADKAAALAKAQRILGPRFEEWAAACLNEVVNSSPKEFLQ